MTPADAYFLLLIHDRIAWEDSQRQGRAMMAQMYESKRLLDEESMSIPQEFLDGAKVQPNTAMNLYSLGIVSRAFVAGSLGLTHKEDPE
jgi:hypothetical protein